MKFLKHYAPFLIRFFYLLAAALVLITAVYLSRRPSRTAVVIDNIYPGSYQRGIQNSPYRAVYHLIEIDLTTPTVSLIGTDPVSGFEYGAQTVEEFALANDTEIAINGNFFYPFHSHNPFDFFPHRGDMVELSGLAINNGQLHSDPRPDWPTLCVSGDQRVEIGEFGRCPTGTQVAIAGNIQTVKDGKLGDLPDENLYTRNAVGVNEFGDRLWILMVDGKQPFYSEGASYFLCAQLLKAAGATDVLHLDGGGSTTLVIKQDGNQQVFNAPYHTRVVMRQRPVANHLGIQIDPNR
ncbi:MAG: phosphodiester glycosidase family protein [Chloroflexota bacterium]